MAATLANCQVLVSKLQSAVAAAVLANMRVGSLCYREYQQAVIATGSQACTLNLTTETGATLDANYTIADLTDINSSLPVDRLLADANFFASTVNAMAKKVARTVDAALMAKYSAFIGITVIGAASTALADTDYAKIANTLFTVSPSGEPVYLAMASNIPSPGADAYGQLVTLITSAATSGEKLLRAASLGNAMPVFHGMQVVPTADAISTGSGPVSTYNLAFCKNALAFLSCQKALTNDATHVQAYSELLPQGVGVFIGLDYNNATVNQTVHMQVRGVAIAARQTHAVQVRC